MMACPSQTVDGVATALSHVRGIAQPHALASMYTGSDVLSQPSASRVITVYAPATLSVIVCRSSPASGTSSSNHW